MRLYPVLYVIGILMVMVSCQHEANPPLEELIPKNEDPTTVIDSCHPDTVYFERDLLPLLSSNCAFSGCHDLGSAEDDIVLTTYENLMKSDIVRPFDAEDSDLYEAVTESDPDKIMPPPPNDPLTAAQIALIRKWIEQGAKDISCVGGCDSTNVTFSGAIFPLIESRCKGCHSGASPGGGIRLINYDDINKIASDGRFIGAVKHLKGYKAMPLGGQKLPICQITQIEKWIENGAQNN